VPQGFWVGKQPITLRVDSDKLLQDLLTNSLYADKPRWFREILQNAFDACRDLVMIKDNPQPRIEIIVKTDVEEIEFFDTGLGMAPSTVENFLLVAGASYWSSNEYISSVERLQHVGKFGIGFMSIFAVAEHIILNTRHYQSDSSQCYTIREPRRVVKVESCQRAEPGTSIRIKLKANSLSKFDPLELFDSTSPFPEFPLKLIIDGITQRHFTNPTHPSTSTSGISIEEIENTKGEVKLFKRDIDLPGIKGDFYLPKMKLVSADAFIPSWDNLFKSMGRLFEVGSGIYFGGIKYPAFRKQGDMEGFGDIPSLGILRLAVSPNDYPLEMNLARDSFIAGTASQHLFLTISDWLDSVYSEDLQVELDGKDKLWRSAITACYSSAMMHLWVGFVPEFRPSISPKKTSIVPIVNSPWPNFTSIVMKELRFICINRKNEQSFWTIEDFIREKVHLYAIGIAEHEVSRDLFDAILKFDSDAKFLIGLPYVDFGIKELRHWANEEFLVPVESHGRCAYGLRFGTYSRPFEFYPGDLDHLGIPTASGPNSYSILDYRDFMAETKLNPSGGADITAVLNRRNHKSATLISKLKTLKDINAYRRIIGPEIKSINESMKLGRENTYRCQTRETLADTLNMMIRRFVGDMELFEPDDFPPYFDGGQTRPFGRFGMEKNTQHCWEERQKHWLSFMNLS